MRKRWIVEKLEADISELTEARDAVRAALTESIDATGIDWQGGLWKRIMDGEREIQRLTAENAALRRDHEAMEALRNHKVYLVRHRSIDGHFRAESTHEEMVQGFRTGWVEVAIEHDHADAILKAAKAGGE